MNNSSNSGPSSSSTAISEQLLHILKQCEMSALYSLRGPSFITAGGGNNDVAGPGGAGPFVGAPPGSRYLPPPVQQGLPFGSGGGGMPVRPSPLKKPPQAPPQPMLTVEKARDDLLLNVLAAAAASKANVGSALPPPLMLPRDHSADRTETVIENQQISCFDVGGEKRLCLPQLLNAVLRDFTLPEINKACADLHIHCSQCSKEQLEVLKLHQVLPISSVNCGLITKSDAERLTSYLLQSRHPVLPTMDHQHHQHHASRTSFTTECCKSMVSGASGHNVVESSASSSSSSNVSCSSSSSLSTATASSPASPFSDPPVEILKVKDEDGAKNCAAAASVENEKFSSLPVYHECFGRCRGTFKRHLYTNPTADCVECNECSRLFTPNRFVLHSHRHHETKTCHWGFDSANWRLYLHLTPEMEDSKEAEKVLEEEKVKFANVQAQTQPQTQLQATAKRSSDNKHPVYPFAEKRLRLDNNSMLNGGGVIPGLPSIPTLPPVLPDYLCTGLAGVSGGQPMKAAPPPTGSSVLPFFMCDPLTIYHAVLAANAGRAAAAASCAPPSSLLPFVVPPAGSHLLPPQHFPLSGAAAPVAKVVTSATTATADVSHLAVEEAADALLKLAPPTIAIQVDPKHKPAASMVSIEPLKKHILHRTQLKLNTTCALPQSSPTANNCQQQQCTNKSMALKVVTPEEIGTIDNLLNHYVKDPEGLRIIRAKLDETKRHLDGKMDCLLSQNRILQQEIAYLRNKQTTASVVAQTGLTSTRIPTV